MSNEQLLLAAIGALAGCVGHLYYRMDGLHKQCEAEKKECEETTGNFGSDLRTWKILRLEIGWPRSEGDASLCFGAPSGSRLGECSAFFFGSRQKRITFARFQFLTTLHDLPAASAQVHVTRRTLRAVIIPTTTATDCQSFDSSAHSLRFKPRGCFGTRKRY